MGAGGMDRDESRSKPPALTRSTNPVLHQILANREVCVLLLLAVHIIKESVIFLFLASKAKARVFFYYYYYYSYISLAVLNYASIAITLTNLQLLYLFVNIY